MAGRCSMLARAWMLGLGLVLGSLGACGDDGGPSNETGNVATTMAASGESTAASGDSESTAAAALCADASCGSSCEPPECIEGDCTAYACSEQGECLPFDSFYCQSQLDACAGLLCEDECVDPFCNDGGLEEGGMCAPAFCNVDVACVPIARFETTPCEGPASGDSSSGGGATSSSG